MKNSIPVVDIFAGPGGLGEGVASLGRDRFEIAISAEMEESAHQTLLLRAFYRNLTKKQRREFYYPFVESGSTKLAADIAPAKGPVAKAWKLALEDAQQLTVGSPPDDRVIEAVCSRLARSNQPWMLIGGPPCQAYSQVGRVKNRANKDYDPDKDHRFFLYKHYLNLVSNYGPAAFVMENVAGMLSAKFSGGKIVDHILDQISAIRFEGNGYRLFSLSIPSIDPAGRPKDFLIRADHHGVPQARQRVIILGVREDVLKGKNNPDLLSSLKSVSAGIAMAGLPRLRSTLNGKGVDKGCTAIWREAISNEYKLAVDACLNSGEQEVADILLDAGKNISTNELPWDGATIPIVAGESRADAIARGMPSTLADWLMSSDLRHALNHDARGHMSSDLGRYGFCAAFGKVHGRTPKSHEFPIGLIPDHKNWSSGQWADRFRVVLENEPSRTVVKHISKDGNYYIHWDPTQCRSLTVREAARLQTFPDDYYFLGGRTSAYGQVGNAVPPYLARQIAQIVEKVLT